MSTVAVEKDVIETENKKIASVEDFKGADIISASQFTRGGLNVLFNLADRMKSINRRETKCNVLHRDIIGVNFFEASTRTRQSSVTAGLRLGASISGMVEIERSSMTKGESLEDTIAVLSMNSDLMVIRHPQEGFANIAARLSDVPVINAGDGPGEHPTQALLDVNTIRCRKGRIDKLTIAMVGDLEHGRTVHSLARLLMLYEDIKFIFIAPESIKMPQDTVTQIRNMGFEVQETDDMEEGIASADVVYMTRMQENRFPSPEDFEAVNGIYRLDRKKVEKHCLDDVTIMHPLPRVNELAPDIDEMPNAAYLGRDSQVEYGILTKMALFIFIFGKSHKFV